METTVPIHRANIQAGDSLRLQICLLKPAIMRRLAGVQALTRECTGRCDLMHQIAALCIAGNCFTSLQVWKCWCTVEIMIESYPRKAQKSGPLGLARSWEARLSIMLHGGGRSLKALATRSDISKTQSTSFWYVDVVARLTWMPSHARKDYVPDCPANQGQLQIGTKRFWLPHLWKDEFYDTFRKRSSHCWWPINFEDTSITGRLACDMCQAHVPFHVLAGIKFSVSNALTLLKPTNDEQFLKYQSWKWWMCAALYLRSWLPCFGS